MGKLSKFLLLSLDAGIPVNIHIEERKRLRVLNLILIICAGSPFFFFLSSLYCGTTELILIETIILSTFIIAYLLRGWFKLKLSKFILLFIVPLELFYFPVYVGDVGVEYLFFIFIVGGFYFLDNKVLLLIQVIFISVFLTFSKYFIFHSIYPELYEGFEKTFYYLNIIVTILLSSFSIYLFKADTIRHLTTIEDQAVELKNKIQELEKRENVLTQLFKELNHRVKNNLQMISGLFTMQKYNSRNNDVKIALNAISRRIDTIAILHQHLYREENPFRPNLKTYIQELLQSTLQIMDKSETELELEIDNIFLKIEIASHIGLIINELLSYMMNGGLRGNSEKMKLKIEVKKNESLLSIRIETDSEKNIFSDKEMMNKKDTLDREMIFAIIKEYNGSIEYDKTDNAQIRITMNEIN